jgi:hypothetical protein
LATSSQQLIDLSKNILVGNSLIDDPSLDSKAIDWGKKFPEKFDVIIGNPPYVRQESILEKEKMQISNNNNLGLKDFIIPSKSDLSSYFYYHSLNYLKNNGVLGFIASDSWMMKSYGKNLQEIFLQNCNINQLFRIEGNVFDNANTKTITTFLQKTSSSNQSNVVKLLYWAKKRKNSFEKKIKQNNMKSENWNLYFEIPLITPKISMINLKTAGRLGSGQKTGNNEYFVLNLKTIQDYKISKKYYKHSISSELSEGLLENKNALEFLLNVNEGKKDLMGSVDGRKILNYIEFGERLKIIPKKGNNKTSILLPKLKSISSRKIWYSLNLINPPAIFLGRFADHRMKFFENNGNFFARDNFAFFTPTNNEHIKAFLAFFSSSWFGLYMEKNGHTAGGGALQFLIIDYGKSSVPDFSKLTDDVIKKMNSVWNEYKKTFDRKKIDDVILPILGFTQKEQIDIQNELEFKIQERINSRISHQKSKM